MYVCMYIGMQACRYVHVCSSLYDKSFFFCCCLANRLYANIYIQTNLLPLASVHAVLAEEDHRDSCNSRTLGVPIHCAACYRSSSRLRLSFLSLPLVNSRSCRVLKCPIQLYQIEPQIFCSCRDLKTNFYRDHFNVDLFFAFPIPTLSLLKCLCMYVCTCICEYMYNVCIYHYIHVDIYHYIHV